MAGAHNLFAFQVEFHQRLKGPAMVITKTDFHALYGQGRGRIAGAHNPDADVRVLTALVDSFRSRRVLEIGTNTGETAAAILAGNNIVENFVGVDLPAIWYTHEPAGHFAKHDPRFSLWQLPAGSKDLHADPENLEPFDFVFIDGDHSFEWVEHDSRKAREMLHLAGGVITWHDYQHPTCPDVRRWIHAENERLEAAGMAPIVWVEGTQVCYQIIGRQNASGYLFDASLARPGTREDRDPAA